MINNFKNIESYQEILSCVQHNKSFSKTIITNFFLDENRANLLINLGLLQLLILDNVFFILKRENGFYKVYFNAIDELTLRQGLAILNNLFKEEILQFEIIGKQRDMDKILSIFQFSGYYQYSSMIRMSKMKDKNDIIHNCRTLSLDRVHDLKKIFDDFFDKFVEQIPTIQELTTLIENRNIVIVSDINDMIQGFLISEINGFTSHLRYWFVHPQHRNKRVGSSLMNFFFSAGENVRRQILWVIETNSNAIVRYEYYGFKKEELRNIVLINKNLKYDTKNH